MPGSRQPRPRQSGGTAPTGSTAGISPNRYLRARVKPSRPWLFQTSCTGSALKNPLTTSTSDVNSESSCSSQSGSRRTPGVGDRNQVARGGLDGQIAAAGNRRPGRSNTAQRQPSRPGLENVPRPVGRAAVDDDDFVRESRLLRNRLQQAVDCACLVEHGDDQGDALSGVTASHGNRPASLARSPALATLTLPWPPTGQPLSSTGAWRVGLARRRCWNSPEC